MSSTVQDRKPPSAGTKVDLGRKAPVQQEGTGSVPSESLAAEPRREGGAFSSNRGIQSENISAADTSPSKQSGRTSTSKSGEAGSVPGNVASPYHKDAKGPHGRKVKEGADWDEAEAQDGLAKALNSEPGSEDDPSRLAERVMQQKRAVTGGDTGPRQTALVEETKYDVLDPETPS